MVIHETSQNGMYILDGSGRLNFKARHVFQLAIKAALASEATHIVFDLSQVPFIDSAGLALIILASRECEEQKIKLSLCQPQKSVKDIFELTNMSKHIAIFDSLQNALSQQYHSVLK